MNARTQLSLAALALLFCLGGSGCLNLKPVADPVRYFLLTPMELSEPLESAVSRPVSLGVEPVTIPSYLARPWMVVRTGETEIHYSDNYKWGEQVDKGIQRIVAQNLAQLLGTDQVYLNTWRKASVDLELRLVILRFDVDESGQVVLEAQWQLNGTTSSTDHHMVRKQGPDPFKDPGGAVAVMSEALAELSQSVARSAHVPGI